MLERAPLSVGGVHALDALLHVDLVEAERGRGSSGKVGVGVLTKLPNSSDVRQPIGIVEQVMESDERVRLAAAVRHLELADGLGILARQSPRDVLDQLPQRVGGVGQREELLRILVDRPFSPPP